MSDLNSIGKIFILFGSILLLIGTLFLFVGKIPHFGRLPGDIYMKKGNFTFYFPLVTSLILSVIITFVLNLILRIHR